MLSFQKIVVRGDNFHTSGGKSLLNCGLKNKSLAFYGLTFQDIFLNKLRVYSYTENEKISRSPERNSNYFLRYRHFYQKTCALFLSGYNIEWKAMFVLGSPEKFAALHFNKLPKFHSDMIFLCLYFQNTFQCNRYLPLKFASFLPKSPRKQLVISRHLEFSLESRCSKCLC